jgi:hypothetical protein
VRNRGRPDGLRGREPATGRCRRCRIRHPRGAGRDASAAAPPGARAGASSRSSKPRPLPGSPRPWLLRTGGRPDRYGRGRRGMGQRKPGSCSPPEAAERLGAARPPSRGRRALRAGAGLGPAARTGPAGRGRTDGHRPFQVRDKKVPRSNVSGPRTAPTGRAMLRVPTRLTASH